MVPRNHHSPRASIPVVVDQVLPLCLAFLDWISCCFLSGMSGGLDVHCSRAQAAEDPRQLEIPIWNILRLCGDIPRVQQLVTTCRALPGKLKNVHGEWAHLNSGQHMIGPWETYGRRPNSKLVSSPHCSWRKHPKLVHWFRNQTKRPQPSFHALRTPCSKAWLAVNSALGIEDGTSAPCFWSWGKRDYTLRITALHNWLRRGVAMAKTQFYKWDLRLMGFSNQRYDPNTERDFPSNRICIPPS